MKLNRLEISKFRCFDNYRIDLAPGINVLYGFNGAGKTSLINAIHKALSFIFADFKGHNDLGRIGAGNPSLRVETFKPTDSVMFINPETGNPDPELWIKASAEIEGIDGPKEWCQKASTSTYKLQPRLYTPLAIEFATNVQNNIVALPVLAYYSDSYPHIESRTQLAEKVSPYRSFGYHQWNEDSACSWIWIDKLENALQTKTQMEQKLRELDSSNPRTQNLYEKYSADLITANAEIEAVRSALRTFSHDDSQWEVYDFLLTYPRRIKTLSLVDINGKQHDFRLLPAGYRRLYYMVMDIAYRAHILNRGTDMENTNDSPGIVIIDEIDLHLHPSLQRSVLER